MLYITLEAVSENHEETGGGDYHEYPAIRVSIRTSPDGEVLFHRCEDIPGIFFDNRKDSLKYATETIGISNISLIGKAIVQWIKD